MKLLISVVLLNIRLISPSVIIPIIFSFFNTAVTPNLFSEISTITSAIELSNCTCGTWLFSIRSETLKYNRFPKAPPGWYFAKSLTEKPLKSCKQTAKASPITNCAVVLVVGAKLFGQASFSTKVFSGKSAFLPRKELIFPVIAIILFP